MPKAGIGAPAPAPKRKLHAPKARAAVTFKYRRQYAVIVVCDDERTQERTYTRLTRSGLRCKVVCV
ncbi:MAG: hypothetical protein KIS92_00790 [Planctomycetota bacterium]|nr:hypothetical protein [Planctomycetota bacterium]